MFERGLEVSVDQGCHRLPVTRLREPQHLLVLVIRDIGEGAIHLSCQTNERLGLRTERADVRQQPLTTAMLVQREMQILMSDGPLMARSRGAEVVEFER